MDPGEPDDLRALFQQYDVIVAGGQRPNPPADVPAPPAESAAREHHPYMLTDQELLALEDARRAYIDRRQPMLALPAPP